MTIIVAGRDGNEVVPRPWGWKLSTCLGDINGREHSASRGEGAAYQPRAGDLLRECPIEGYADVYRELRTHDTDSSGRIY